MKAQTQCEAGKYTATQGQSTCLPAEPGEYVPTPGWSKEPEKCKPGETSEAEASSCDACPSGSYAKDSASPSCTLAKAGHYVPDDDRTKEIQCDEGYYSPGPGASTCFACSAGAFSEAAGFSRRLTMDEFSRYKERFIDTTVASLPWDRLCGWVLKARSPSCGLGSTPFFRADVAPGDVDASPAGVGDGLWAAALVRRDPGLPLIDELGLADEGRRAAWLRRVQERARRVR